MPNHRRKHDPSGGGHGAEDFPFTMKLPDGRRLLIEVPGRWVTVDRDGSPLLTPEAVALLDRVQAAFQSVLSRPLTPAYLRTLREALGLTQKELGEAVGVDSMTVSRWERGEFGPRRGALVRLERLRKAALRRGVAVPA
jgi:DNA-binding transcriptional regulator YiaG